MALPKNIVIVEDEAITQRYLQDIFSQYDITVTGCFDNAKETLAKFKSLPYDMLLMDINIKGPMDGIQLGRELLRMSSVPIIFITAHNDDKTIDELVELAPYACIGKPFSSKELMMTLRVAYKRFLTHTALSSIKTENIPNDVVIDKTYSYARNMHALYANNKMVKLNQKQTILLSFLVEHPNQTIHFDTLIAKVWGGEEIADSALRTLVYSLRKLLPEFPLISHSKMGYMLRVTQTGGNV